MSPFPTSRSPVLPTARTSRAAGCTSCSTQRPETCSLHTQWVPHPRPPSLVSPPPRPIPPQPRHWAEAAPRSEHASLPGECHSLRCPSPPHCPPRELSAKGEDVDCPKKAEGGKPGQWPHPDACSVPRTAQSSCPLPSSPTSAPIGSLPPPTFLSSTSAPTSPRSPGLQASQP